MKKALRNIAFILGCIMIFVAACNGISVAIDRITMAIYEVSKGMIFDRVPLGALYYHGISGTILGYIQLTVLLGSVAVMLLALLAAAIFFFKIELDILKKEIHTQLKKKEKKEVFPHARKS